MGRTSLEHVAKLVPQRTLLRLRPRCTGKRLPPNGEDNLSNINRRFLELIAELLEIGTPLRWSTDYRSEGTKTRRLVSLCEQAGATDYLSGPAAKAYLDESMFEQAGISVRWMEYGPYREYPQLYPPFEHQVSILDRLFSVGPQASTYLQGES